MHETFVAKNLIQAIEAEAAKISAKPISATISCGQMNPINDESLNFAFEIAARDTICDGLKLHIKHIPLKATCRNCGTDFDFDLYSPSCRKCDESDFEIAPDAPLLLEEIEFEDTGTK